MTRSLIQMIGRPRAAHLFTPAGLLAPGALDPRRLFTIFLVLGLEQFGALGDESLNLSLGCLIRSASNIMA